MKVSGFKLLIREAVKAAVKEALIEVFAAKTNLNEGIGLNFGSDSFSMTSDEEDDETPKIDPRVLMRARMAEQFGMPEVKKVAGPFDKKANPLADFLNDTAASLTPQDMSMMRSTGGE